MVISVLSFKDEQWIIIATCFQLLVRGAGPRLTSLAPVASLGKSGGGPIGLPVGKEEITSSVLLRVRGGLEEDVSLFSVRLGKRKEDRVELNVIGDTVPVFDSVPASVVSEGRPKDWG
jgi:hypothetical protein